MKTGRMAMWIYLTIGAVMVLVGGTLVIGALLPREHTCTRSVVLTQSAQTVWDAVTNADEMPSWRTGLRRVELKPDVDGQKSWVEYHGSGAIPMTAHVWEPPVKLMTKIDDDGLPFGGTWTLVIEPLGGAAGGCRVRITEDGFVKSPPFRFVSKFVMGHSATMETYLRDLAMKFGQDAVIEP